MAPLLTTCRQDPEAASAEHGRDDFYKAIEGAAMEVKESAAAAGAKTTPPLIVTEFNCGLGINCADAPYAASFVAQHALSSQRIKDEVPIQSYW